MFGVFANAYKDMPTGVSNVWTTLTVGNEGLDAELYQYNPVGAHLMYYATCISLYLILSQFFIAILVGTLQVWPHRLTSAAQHTYH